MSAYGNREECTCLPGYFGAPPNCRPECVFDADCPSTEVCLQQTCKDPCSNVCGVNAQCETRNHVVLCSCLQGFTGDAFSQCTPIPPPVENVVTEEEECDCGYNALCNAQGYCECSPGYFGNPLVECRPECVINNDCPQTKACMNQKCEDPCAGSCGVNALCRVINHMAQCYCPDGFTGNPFSSCRPYVPPGRELTGKKKRATRIIYFYTLLPLFFFQLKRIPVTPIPVV